jgi:glyoxylase-like metal-dependent hydrolase (beta-lactamase superfamily II)
MSLDRRAFLQIAAAGMAAAALPVSAPHAKLALQKRQSPGWHRIAVGDYEVTAINDGLLPIDPALYAAAPQAEAKELLERAHRQAPGGVPTAVNAYVVNTGSSLVLIDTGATAAMGANVGKTLDSLTAAGIEPSAVDVVFITHLHPDHTGGLVDAQGKAVFANAELVLTEKEYAFWHDDGILSQAPAGMKAFFEGAQNAVKPYAARIRKIADGDIVPGLTAVSAPGHTPGHAMVRVASGKDTLLVWGDIVHTATLQFPHPDWAIAFDTDQKQAIATRQKVFDMVATDGVKVAGMHLDFPGVGHISRTKSGYEYYPAVWSPTL